MSCSMYVDFLQYMGVARLVETGLDIKPGAQVLLSTLLLEILEIIHSHISMHIYALLSNHRAQPIEKLSSTRVYY